MHKERRETHALVHFLTDTSQQYCKSRKKQEGEGLQGHGVASGEGAGGENVSAREHVVRDMRQQMERRGPWRLAAAILQRGSMV